MNGEGARQFLLLRKVVLGPPKGPRQAVPGAGRGVPGAEWAASVPGAEREVKIHFFGHARVQGAVAGRPDQRSCLAPGGSRRRLYYGRQYPVIGRRRAAGRRACRRALNRTLQQPVELPRRAAMISVVLGVTLARGRAAVLLAALRRGDTENVMIDENVAKREVETMEWSADVGAGSQATAAAEMQRWA
jgi:hypothetical protein